jgi:PAS domain S-box-containing protein
MSLKVDGHRVFTALSGEEALAVFEEKQPEIVVTDIKMPGMNGIEVLQQIKARNAETEVIIITGHGDIDSAIEALQHGASDFINKPVRDEALSIALNRAREKYDIKKQLREYTDDLEAKVEAATRELRRRANFQTKLIRSSNDGIIATDQNLNIVLYNPGAERIFGYEPVEVIARRSIRNIYPDHLAKRFEAAMGDKNGARAEFDWQETQIANKDGEQIPVRFSGTVLYENSHTMGSVAFFQDLREIKRLEKELLRSERLAAIGQTVAGLAHGIKNILHGFKGGSYLVEIGLKRDDTDKLDSGWQMIKKNIRRTSDLVLDLLSYSKQREPNIVVCRPNEIVDEVCDIVQVRADEANIRVERALDPVIGQVKMDPHTLHQALLNLATNAVDACLFDERSDKNWVVRVKSIRRSASHLGFEVSDNGIGMSQETLAKLFTSFFSTKGHRGTGLGLMVTRKLIDESRGDISVTSQPGSGTTFSVSLPYTEVDNR